MNVHFFTSNDSITLTSFNFRILSSPHPPSHPPTNISLQYHKQELRSELPPLHKLTSKLQTQIYNTYIHLKAFAHPLTVGVYIRLRHFENKNNNFFIFIYFWTVYIYIYIKKFPTLLFVSPHNIVISLNTY